MVVLKKINLTKAFAAFDETWTPHIGGDINDFQVKLTKLEGAFHWHHHEEEDELFLVVKGTLRMKLRDENGGDIVLGIHHRSAWGGTLPGRRAELRGRAFRA